MKKHEIEEKGGPFRSAGGHSECREAFPTPWPCGTYAVPLGRAPYERGPVADSEGARTAGNPGICHSSFGIFCRSDWSYRVTCGPGDQSSRHSCHMNQRKPFWPSQRRTILFFQTSWQNRISHRQHQTPSGHPGMLTDPTLVPLRRVVERSTAPNTSMQL